MPTPKSELRTAGIRVRHTLTNWVGTTINATRTTTGYAKVIWDGNKTAQRVPLIYIKKEPNGSH